MKPFNPAYGKGKTVAPSNVSARTEIDALGQNEMLALTNLSSVTCYVRTGNSSCVATTADYPVPPNSQVSITKFENDTHLAYITASGTSSLHAIPGRGI